MPQDEANVALDKVDVLTEKDKAGGAEGYIYEAEEATVAVEDMEELSSHMKLRLKSHTPPGNLKRNSGTHHKKTRK